MRSNLSSSVIMWIVGVIILISLLGWATVRILNHPATDEVGSEGGTDTQTEGVPKAPVPLLSETYRDAKYGFEISHPAHVKTREFTSFHALKDNWRVNATPEEIGTQVVSIPLWRIDNNEAIPTTYPLFFAAEVRVGVSNDVAMCYKLDDGYSMRTVADVEIGGEIWKKFIFGDAAMMQYLSGASYRTTKNGLCYVMEQIRTGSAYRDDSMVFEYSDRELDAMYEQTTPIIMSFKFMN